MENTTMSAGRFFAVGDLDADDRSWWWLELSKRSEHKMYDLAKLIKAGDRDKVRGVQVKLMRGRRRPDYIAGIGEHIVSSQVADVLRKFNVGDAWFLPITVFDQGDNKILADDFQCVVPQRGAGRPSFDSGYMKLFNGSWRKDPDLKDAYGLHFDHSTWTGLDVFELQPRSPLLVTAPVAEALRSLPLSGVRIEDVTEYRIWLRDLQVPLTRRAFENEARNKA